jgi:N-methylhydantoinase A
VHDSRFYYEGQWHDAAIYNRSLLHEGMVVNGAAIIGEMDATTVILPGYRASVDAIGNLLITAAAAGGK